MNSDQPALSVLLTAGNRRERVANALASVLTQSLVDRIEVIVLECGDPDPVPVPGQDYPCVRTVQFPQGVTAGYVRAEAVRMARASIVVFLEEHAEAGPGWVEGILKAFRDDKWVAVGPQMRNGSPGLGVANALSICYYPLYQPPADRAEVDWLPLHNTAYRRAAVLEYDADLERLFALEILLQWRLREDGYHLLLDPACQVTHFYETEISSVWQHEINAQRAFTANRAELYRWPLWKRLGRALSAPLILVVRPLKLLMLLLRRRPAQLGRYFIYLPHMLASTYLACAAGEFVGLLLGAGDGDARYLQHSVNHARLLPTDFPHYSLQDGSR